MYRLSRSLGLCILALLLLNACNSVPKHAKYIPKDAAVVVGLNTGALNKKVAWSMITGSKLLDQLKQQSPDAKAKSALDDISNAGIDWMNTLYFYARPDNRFDNHAKMCLVLPLEDAGKWEAFLKKTFPEASVKKVKDRSESMLGDKVYAAWTGDMAILMNTVVILKTDTVTAPAAVAEAVTDTFAAPAGDVTTVTELKSVDDATTAAEMDICFNLPKQESIVENSRFKQLEKDGHDISIFVAYDAIMDNAAVRDQMGSGNMNMMLNGSLWKNSAMAGGIDFEKGKIVSDMRYYPSDSMREVAKELGREHVDNDLLARLPSQNLNLAAGYHFSPDALKILLDKMGLSGMANLALMQKGLSVDDILGAFTGDMGFAINDFKMAKAVQDPTLTPGSGNSMEMQDMSRPEMNMVYAVKIRDKAKLDKLLNLLRTEMGLAPAAPGVYTFPAGTDTITAIVTEKYIAIANKPANARSFQESKGNMPAMVKQDISGHTFGMVMDFNTLLANVAPGATGKANDAAVMQEIRAMFASATMNGGDFRSNGNSYHMELNLVDKSENSLLQLLNFIQKVSATQQKNTVVMQ